MAESEEGGLVKCVESLLADKQAMATREQKLIADLNGALEKMGYRVVPINGSAAGTSTAKKRGRPPKSLKTAPPKVAAPAA